MLKRILAAALAVCLVLLTFGCGQNADEQETQPTRKSAAEGGQRIAIIIGDQSQNPEIYAAAAEIARTYDDSIMIVKYAQNYYMDNTAVSEIASTVAENDSVTAMIFADGVTGTGEAVKKVREMRSDMYIAVCNPHEGSVEMHDANLVLSVDFPALGEQMVKKAKEMGAESFVFYTTNRHLKYSSVVALRNAVEEACKAEKMTFKAMSSVDLYDESRTLEIAKQYLAEDAARQMEKFGAKTALFCTEPQVQGALAAQAIRHGMVMPATFMPSPLSLAADLGVDLTGHETDSAYALEQLKAGDSGAAGHVATWSFSAYAAFLQAALDAAIGAVNDSGPAASVKSVTDLLTANNGGTAVTVTTDANKAYLVQSGLVVL
ncbi:MAG: DUF3798 domain-containing protein [Clostridia bacterium]|nr:DUF3798 domain-containing protein [Clostridia bacterium]